ncbi:MAG: PEP-CTERM sorting domain-containing protein, partial [bacterium]|nr:PEP-CTERM sorting domain-containing protein [bacterium]
YYAGYVFQYEGSSSSIGTIYGTGSDFAQASTGLGYKDDVWHHIVANLGQDMIELYVDGTLISSDPGQGSLVQNDSNLYFGRHRSLGRYFNGQLDDIRLYNGGLSQSEVNALVPEPMTMIMLATGIPLLLKRRRSQS